MAPLHSSSLSSSGGDLISLIQEIALVVLRNRPRDIHGFLAEYLGKRDRGDVAAEKIPKDPAAINALNRLYTCLDGGASGNGGGSVRPTGVGGAGAKTTQETQNAGGNVAKKGGTPSRIPVWTPSATASSSAAKSVAKGKETLGGNASRATAKNLKVSLNSKSDTSLATSRNSTRQVLGVNQDVGKGKGSQIAKTLDEDKVLSPTTPGIPGTAAIPAGDSSAEAESKIFLQGDSSKVEVEVEGRGQGHSHAPPPPPPPSIQRRRRRRQQEEILAEPLFKGYLPNPKFFESEWDLFRQILSGKVGILEAPLHAAIAGWILLAGFILLIFAFKKLHVQFNCWKMGGSFY